MDKQTLDPSVAPFVPRNSAVSAPFYAPQTNGYATNAPSSQDFYPTSYWMGTSGYCPVTATFSESAAVSEIANGQNNHFNRQRLTSNRDREDARVRTSRDRIDSRLIRNQQNHATAAGKSPQLRVTQSKARNVQKRHSQYTEISSKPVLTTIADGKPVCFMDEDFPQMSPSTSSASSVAPIFGTKITQTPAGPISYSTATMTAKPTMNPTISLAESKVECEQDMPKSEKKKKKKKKSKGISTADSQPTPSTRKAQPLTIGSFICTDIKRNQEHDRRQRPARLSRTKSVATSDAPRNVLDSSAPTKRRGKEREIPKKKKPTTFKRVILKEKELRLIRLRASKSLKQHWKKQNESPEDVDCQKETVANEGDTENITSCGTTPDMDKERELTDLNILCKKLLHCSFFRDYCEQAVTDDIDRLATSLLTDLIRFQDKMFAKDPRKAQIRKRFSCGLKEVSKYLQVGKVKALLLAPDIQLLETNGILDRTVHELVDSARIHNTPVVCALSRKQLAYLCKKKGRVSCIGLLNIDGTQESFSQLLELSSKARGDYSESYETGYQILSSMAPEELENIKRKLPGYCPNEFVALKSNVRKQTFIWKRRNRMEGLQQHPNDNLEFAVNKVADRVSQIRIHN